MKRFLLSTTLAVIGLFILDGQTAKAATKYFVVTATNWNAASWNIVGCDAGAAVAFVAGDDAVICKHQTVNVANAGNAPHGLEVREAAIVDITQGVTLAVGAAGGLNMEPGSLIRITNGSGTGTLDLTGGGRSEVNGEIDLQVVNATLKISDASHEFGGVGRILGQDSSGNPANITISDGLTLTLRPELKVVGALTIQGAAAGETEKFVNDGLVWANSDANFFTIAFANLTVEGHGEFRVGPGHASDEIEFQNTVVATQLNADFSILDGFLDINTCFATSGHLHVVKGNSGGAILCDAGDNADCVLDQCVFAGR